MSFKKKIENMILSRSNSYNFYKNHYEKFMLNKNLDPSVEQEFDDIKNEFNNFKVTTDKQMDTMNYLMRTLFIDYEMNNPKNALKYIQELSSELLVLINNICKENNLNWWLNYGNLLGAVRHGYFVPWDDEVDIAMMRKDYLEFGKIIKNEFKNNGLDDIVEVKFNTNDINGHDILGCLQILVKNKTLLSQSLDLNLAVLNIYSYDYIDEENKRIIKKEYKICKNDLLNDLISGNDFESSLEKYYVGLNLTHNPTKYIISSPESLSFTDKVFIFDTDRIFPLNDIKFGEDTFNSPNDVHFYLKTLYKDYLNLPRVISMPENVDNFRYIDNNEEIFTETINRLKEVNLKY